jgi:DNA polymerase-3 subunit gamma/tau
MTLYLKYRSKNLDELDLPEVSQSLKKIAKSGKIPHAFLFSGPKGTGKTSAARILSKIINCEHLKGSAPCDKCEQCVSISKGTNLDVIEMDAASHRGIDDVRVLRDAVKLSPVSAKKKIYIIDEAHMLTTEASNALLKTLEEPPGHVVFILATTNPEKLIGTIRSRTTNITFRKAKVSEIVRSLERVAKGEKIKVDNESLGVIARASHGAFRDAIKILEQVLVEGVDLSKESLEEYLFTKKAIDVEGFCQLLAKKDIKALTSQIEKMVESGASMEVFVSELLESLQASLLAKVGIGEDIVSGIDKIEIIRLIELLLDSQTMESPVEELPLEVAVIKWCGEDKNLGSRMENPERSGEENKPEAKITTSALQNSGFQIPGSSSVSDDSWKTILTQVKPINASIEALLRAARPIQYDGKTLTLGVFYKFHKERLEAQEHRRVLESIVAEVLGSPTKVTCVLVEPPPKRIIEEAHDKPVLTEGEDKDIIKVAEEIFGN